MNIAIIIGGWYYPRHFFDNLKKVLPPQNSELDFFVVSHRNPLHIDIKNEMAPRAKNSKLDQELYKEIVTHQYLTELGFKVDETENTAGDYCYFNQWAELYDSEKYDYVVFMHDDNYLLPEFKNILVNIVSGQTEFYHDGKLAKPDNIDCIANSMISGQSTARGSFNVWSKKFLKTLGRFSLENVKLFRPTRIDTPREASCLTNWNEMGTNLAKFVQKNNFISYRLSPYYRVSKYMIECERGLVMSDVPGFTAFACAGSFFQGMRFFEITY